MTKQLYRSEKNRMVAGVCGGVGEFFEIDPTLVRLVYLMITIFTGLVPGLVCYLIALAVVPDAPFKGGAPSNEAEHVSDAVKGEGADDSTKV